MFDSVKRKIDLSAIDHAQISLKIPGLEIKGNINRNDTLRQYVELLVIIVGIEKIYNIPLIE